jgi:propanol-preferring alcohol dehydrogenase
LLSAWRSRRRRRHRTSALRRPDWLALACHGGRRKASRHFRLRRGRAYRGAGGRRSVYAFTRAGDVEAQDLAKSLGAEWSGAAEEQPPVPLDAAIIYAPVGALVPLALRAVRKGGRVVCAGIHMSDIPSFPYEILWGERQLLSVANLTRRDGIEFFEVAALAGIKTHTSVFPLREANEVLSKLRAGRITGAAVLQP